jgi:hypothetical protein
VNVDTTGVLSSSVRRGNRELGRATVDNDARVEDEGAANPWPQRMLDNLWLLLALGIVVPAVLYLGWGLWELAELPTWGGR